MIPASLFYPLVVAAVIAVLATTAHRRLPPHVAARFVTCALVLIVIGGLPTLLLVAFGFLAHAPLLGPSVEWCTRAIGIHEEVPVWLGGPAALLMTIGVVRSVKVVRDHRRLRCDQPGPIEVLSDPAPLAVTLPGRAGQIVLSTGLLEMLDAVETEIVIAHERAHGRHRHDRFLLTAELAAAVLPPLRSMSTRLLFSVERWADEAAVRACGNRRLVAETLGKVALHGAQPASVVGFAGLGVAGRVQVLLDAPVPRPRRRAVAALWTSLAVSALLSLYQLHHLERLVAALCPH